MYRKLNKMILLEIRKMEKMAREQLFQVPKIIQFVDDRSNRLTKRPLTIEFEAKEHYPEKLDLVTAMLEWMEENSETETKVICSLYGEHLVGNNGELVYFQVKEGNKIVHRVSCIQREGMEVNTAGSLNEKIKVKRYINYEPF